jgi:2-polyprenyl-3-methyl-5-hydroxy-6-metoxy-1,4-benzoquinol methylase
MPSESRVFLAPEEHTLDSQFLRRQLANLVDDDGKWDWATFPTEDRVHSVSKAFTEWLKAHADDYAIATVNQSAPSLHFETSVARLTARSYEKIGGKFKERWQGALQYNTIGRFLSHIPAGPSSETERKIRLMDAGCGPGLYTRVFADLGFECVAVDPSKSMLQDAKEYLGNNTRGHAVTLVQARLEELDSVVWGSFDAVWFSAVLLHIPRKAARQVLRLLSKLLDQDGVLYLSTRLLCDETGHDLPALETRREGRVFVYYQESELEDLFTNASLQIVMSWKGMTTVGTLGDKQNKPWRHYLLTKSRLSED